MSVQNPTYIIWGIVLPYPKDSDTDEFEDAMDLYCDSAFKENSVNKTDDVTVLLDGMGGKYMIVGHVLKRTDAHGAGFGIEVIPNFAMSPMNGELVAEHARWKAGIDKACVAMGVEANGSEINWMVVTHYR